MFVVPAELGQLDRPPSLEDSFETVDNWRRDHNGVYANEVGVSFTARSDLNEPSIITALRVEVVDRRAPIQGTLIEPSGAGDLIPREVRADLEADPPKVTLSRGWRFPLTVSNENIELFTVTARVVNCYCFWRIHVDVVGPDGEATTQVIDDNGEPFAVTSTQAAQNRVKLPDNDSEKWPS
jgi:hypothetical protein